MAAGEGFTAQRATLQRAVAEAGMAREWPKLEPFVRDSIALSFARKAKHAVGASRFGGLPDLEADRPWPHVDGKPLDFLGQLRLAEVHPWDVRGLLPADGLLSLFVGHGVDEDEVYRPIARVIHLPPDARLISRQAPKGLRPHAPVVAVRFEGKSVLWPFGGRGPKTKEAYARLYMDLYDVGGATRHHALLSTDRAREGLVDPKRDEVLLRLDRADDVPYDFEEASVLYLIAARTDLAARRFDRVRAVDASTI